MKKEIHECNLVAPTQINGYSLFEPSLEGDSLIFFHATPSGNFDSIVNRGFLSAQKLGVGQLTSVSYAKRSHSCLAYLKNKTSQDFIVFAVKFVSTNLPEIKVNHSDIHVYADSIQPEIVCFCKLPSGFSVS